MTDRASTASNEGATVCPFVAFDDDRNRRATDPDLRHRCFAEPTPEPRALVHQRRFCLSPEFPSCPTFQDWAVRAAAAGVSLSSAPSVRADARRSRDWAAPPPWVGADGTADAPRHIERRHSQGAVSSGEPVELPLEAAGVGMDAAPEAGRTEAAPVQGDERHGTSTLRRRGMTLVTGRARSRTSREPAPGGGASGTIVALGDRGTGTDGWDSGTGGASDAGLGAGATGASRAPDGMGGSGPPDGAGAPGGTGGSGAPGGTGGSGAPGGTGGIVDSADRPPTGRGFAYDLIAQDPAFASDDPPEASAPMTAATRPPTAAGGSSDMAAVADGAASVRGLRAQSSPHDDPVARAESVDHTRWRPEPPPSFDDVQHTASARTAPPPRATPPLPEPEYLPPQPRQMASPATRAPHGTTFEGDREWDRPRRFEAYPTLRTRMSVGMPAIPRPGRLPPVAIGAIALLLAALVLFALPGFFAGGPSRPAGGGAGSGGATTRPSGSPGTTVSAAPTTAAPPTAQIYIVKSGDTLSKIAKQFGFTVQEILDANPDIKNPNSVRIGQRIVIPSAFPTASPVTDETPSGADAASPTASP